MRAGLRAVLLGRQAFPAIVLPYLLVVWDAERPDLITRDQTGAVSSWRDSVSAQAATQATGASQPIWSATGFLGRRPGVTADGVDDNLLAVVASLPADATPSEMWALFDQTTAPAVSLSTSMISYGDGASFTRRLCRFPVGGVNRAGMLVGNGVTNINVSNSLVNYTGPHVVRAAIGATSTSVDCDGASEPGTAVIPTTLNTRVRLFASSAASVGNFGKGTANFLAITLPMPAAPAAALTAYLKARAGIP